MFSDPVAFFITFTTYGTWLHGNEKLSIDKQHNHFGLAPLEPNPSREAFQRARLKHAQYILDQPRRSLVLATIQEVARHRSWHLWAAHVRSNHVHLVITADAKPEKVLSDLKAWTTRRIKESFSEASVTDRWTQHGSTRYLWNKDQLQEAAHYVVEQQGEPMAAYLAKFANPKKSEPEA